MDEKRLFNKDTAPAEVAEFLRKVAFGVDSGALRLESITQQDVEGDEGVAVTGEEMFVSVRNRKVTDEDIFEEGKAKGRSELLEELKEALDAYR